MPKSACFPAVRALLGLTLVGLSFEACGSSETASPACGPGTALSNGQCVIVAKCGAGTVLKEEKCIPESTGGQSGAGTSNQGGGGGQLNSQGGANQNAGNSGTGNAGSSQAGAEQGGSGGAGVGGSSAGGTGATSGQGGAGQGGEPGGTSQAGQGGTGQGGSGGVGTTEPGPGDDPCPPDNELDLNCSQTCSGALKIDCTPYSCPNNFGGKVLKIVSYQQLPIIIRTPVVNGPAPECASYCGLDKLPTSALFFRAQLDNATKLVVRTSPPWYIGNYGAACTIKESEKVYCKEIEGYSLDYISVLTDAEMSPSRNIHITTNLSDHCP